MIYCEHVIVQRVNFNKLYLIIVTKIAEITYALPKKYQISKKVLPTFQKLLPKSLDILYKL